MIIINTISDVYFELNAIRFAKIYQPLKQGAENIGIYNINDTRQQLQAGVKYDQFEIDGTVYATQAETIEAMLNVIFEFELPADITSTLEGKTDKGGYIGTTQDLKNELDAKQFQGLLSYQTLALLQAVTPDPLEGTPAKVVNDGTASNNGYYSFVGAAWVKDNDLANGIVTDDNVDATSGGTVSDALIPIKLEIGNTLIENAIVVSGTSESTSQVIAADGSYYGSTATDKILKLNVSGVTTYRLKGYIKNTRPNSISLYAFYADSSFGSLLENGSVILSANEDKIIVDLEITSPVGTGQIKVSIPDGSNVLLTETTSLEDVVQNASDIVTNASGVATNVTAITKGDKRTTNLETGIGMFKENVGGASFDMGDFLKRADISFLDLDFFDYENTGTQLSISVIETDYPTQIGDTRLRLDKVVNGVASLLTQDFQTIAEKVVFNIDNTYIKGLFTFDFSSLPDFENFQIARTANFTSWVFNIDYLIRNLAVQINDYSLVDLRTSYKHFRSAENVIPFMYKDSVEWLEQNRTPRFNALNATDWNEAPEAWKEVINWHKKDNGIESGLSCILNTGDFIASTSIEQVEFQIRVDAMFDAIEAENQIPIFWCNGNHDLGEDYNQTTVAGVAKIPTKAERKEWIFDRMYDRLTTAQKANLTGLTGNAMYYYYDFADQKTRIIALDDYEAPYVLDGGGLLTYSGTAIYDGATLIGGRNTYHSKEQLEFLVAALDSAPEDYNVIIMNHQGLNESYAEDNSGIGNIGRTVEALREILAGFKTKASGTANANAVTGAVAYGVAYNFTARTNSHIAVINGHYHEFKHIVEAGAGNVDVIQCISLYGVTSYLKFSDSVSQVSADIISIDYDTNELYTLRYGQTRYKGSVGGNDGTGSDEFGFHFIDTPIQL